MKLIYLGILPLLSAIPSALPAEETTVSLPPDSIAQWYKPAAKRHVWLHNMFKLRREMQAVKTYSEKQSQPLTQKWVELFTGHYRKIQDMVPEWKDELDFKWADKLDTAAEAGDFSAVDQAMRKISHSCNSCHREFRAVTAAVYRTPDYSKIKVATQDAEAIAYPEYMVHLQALVNSIVINMKDDQMADAIADTNQLEHALKQLKPSCSSCHKKSRQADYYLGEETAKSLHKLSTALKAGDKKTAGRAIGETALNACASCHGVHRAVYDLAGQIKP